jgi:hypothetical protein
MHFLAGCQHDEEAHLAAGQPPLVQRQAPAEKCPRQPDRSATLPDLNARLAWTQRALHAGPACRALSAKQGERIANLHCDPDPKSPAHRRAPRSL